ncbi:hypothetical protein FB451DRAFT_643116 [Mycena latifolia]|nr:hypothetical protein FB451DRAFT_643116 [Mycena latifolia]
MFRVTSTYSAGTGFEKVDSPYDGACSLLRAWLRRAKDLPLSITLRCDKERDALPPTILPTIAEFSKRWGRLEISLPNRKVSAFDRIQGPFPLLQSLAVKPSARIFLDARRLSELNDFPQLREVRLLNGLELDSVPTLAQITAIELQSSISMREWLVTFKRFPSSSTSRHPAARYPPDRCWMTFLLSNR